MILSSVGKQVELSSDLRLLLRQLHAIGLDGRYRQTHMSVTIPASVGLGGQSAAAHAHMPTRMSMHVSIHMPAHLPEHSCTGPCCHRPGDSRRSLRRPRSLTASRSLAPRQNFSTLSNSSNRMSKNKNCVLVRRSRARSSSFCASRTTPKTWPTPQRCTGPVSMWHQRCTHMWRHVRRHMHGLCHHGPA